MGVWSRRTRGTKMTESSCESLSMNMKPRLNIQPAAACWCVVHCFLTISKPEPLSDSTWLQAARQEGRGSCEACDWRSDGKACRGGWRRPSIWPCRLEEGTGSGVNRESCPLRAPRRTIEAGRWPQSASPIQSCLGMAGKVWAILSSRKKLQPRTSLPLWGWGSFFI